MTKDHICAGLHSETDYCAICLDPIPDGKPVPTEEEMQSFLSRCQEPFARLHSAMVYKAARRAYKGDWDDRLSIPEVYDSIIEELTEMKAELEKGSSPRDGNYGGWRHS